MTETLIETVLRNKKINIDQAFFDEWMGESLVFAHEIGIPDDAIINFEKEWHGGACPICEKEYKKIKAGNKSADENFKYAYEYYQPDCDCESKEEREYQQRSEVYKKLRIAGVPKLYLNVDWNNWDYRVSPETNESFKRIYDLFVNQKCYEKDASGIIMYGDVGTGKTRTSVCVLREILTVTKFTAAFLQTGGIISKMVDREQGNKYVHELESYDVILFDDMDKMFISNEWIKERIFVLIDQMVSNQKIIIGTTNFRDVSQFADKFGDNIMSRIVNACYFEHFMGNDYRMETKSY